MKTAFAMQKLKAYVLPDASPDTSDMSKAWGHAENMFKAFSWGDLPEDAAMARATR